MRHEILLWMECNDWHLIHRRAYKFWEWVVMPRDSGGRLGLRNWVRWVMR
jgi:hypothetical protein